MCVTCRPATVLLSCCGCALQPRHQSVCVCVCVFAHDNNNNNNNNNNNIAYDRGLHMMLASNINIARNTEESNTEESAHDVER